MAEDSPSAPCRLFVYLARTAPVAVVLRRGPSDWARLSVWRTDDDTFEHGQWMMGRVYERRSDLSPDGSLFVYFVRQSGGRQLAEGGADTWIGVSRPPWFTALALWFIGGTYCAGGFFPAGDALVLGGITSAPDQGTLPSWLALQKEAPYLDGTPDWPDRWAYHNRLLRDGWTTSDIKSPAPVWEHRSPDGAWTLIMAPDRSADFTTYGGRHIDEFAVVEAATGEMHQLGRATWADWDASGRLIVAQDGQLRQWAAAGGTQVIEDFNAQAPDPQPSPDEARRWPREPRA